MKVDEIDEHVRAMGFSIGKNMDDRDVLISRPNMIAIYLSIADRSIQEAAKQYDRLGESLTKTAEGNIQFTGPDAPTMTFNFIESVCTAIVFAYMAAEAFANSLIPDAIVVKRKHKGEEIDADKEWLERNEKLIDKYKKVLPEVYRIPRPTGEAFWTDFTRLENLRNGLVHYKSSERAYMEQEREFLQMLFLHVFKHDVIESSSRLIEWVVAKLPVDRASIPRAYRDSVYAVRTYAEL